MKDVVSINNLKTMSESLKALNKDFYILLEQYKKLREKNYKLKKEFEINHTPPVISLLLYLFSN